MIPEHSIQQALAKIRDRGANYVYFFEHLTSPDWIEPLAKQGFFKNPPKPIQGEKTISHPSWVESQYLVRMAEKNPNAVVQAALQIRKTENSRVNRDILEIALKVPPSLSKLLVPQICSILNDTKGPVITRQIADIVRRLAQHNELGAALKIASQSLDFFPDPRTTHNGDLRANPKGFSRLEPAPRWRVYEFKELLDKGIRAILEKDPWSVLALLSATLDKAIRLSFSLQEAETLDGRDNSVGWRPAVEDHEQNKGFQHKELLVPVLRDAAETLLRTAPSAFDEVEELLGKFRWDIFNRLYIHLCRVLPEVAGSQRIRKILTNSKYFDNYRFQHEWSLLLRAQFKNLSDSDQALILNWIEHGFEPEWRIARHKEHFGESPSPQLVEKWKRHWQLRNLYFISSDLPATWKRHYGDFLAEFGEPEHPGFPIWIGQVQDGAVSPKSARDLLAMPNSDLIAFLRAWRPSLGERDQTTEGLASALTVAIKSDPLRFAPDLNQFHELHPDYVDAAIRGFQEAAEEGRQPGWERLIEFCGWVVTQTDSTEPAQGEPDDHRTWRWARMNVIRLLSRGLKSEKSEIPINLRSRVWSILEVLAEDPLPNRAYEEKYKGGRQYGTLSINTTRGESMHALFLYADWVRCHSHQDNISVSAEEILAPLTRHLDLSKEPTFTIRSIYGQHLPWLNHFFPEWLKNNLEQIFPRDQALVEYRSVAWEAYISFSNPSGPLFELLNEEYAWAIGRLRQETAVSRDYDLAHPDEALAQHLVQLCWWGRTSIDDESSLISQFFKKASDQLRGSLFIFAARALQNTEQVDQQIVTRLQYLFEKRLEAATLNHRQASFEKELSAFGALVWSGKLDVEWTLSTLEKVLPLTTDEEPYGYSTLEFLERTSVKYPAESARCLQLMILSNQEQFGWYLKPESVRTILSNALKAEDELARRAGAEAQETLLRMGQFEFKDLR
jgi:hypothetical protein